MNTKIYTLLFVLIFICSCSDAEIVSGVYTGKIYAADTVNATATVVKVSESYVRIDVKANGASTGYIEYAQLTKNADEAYNLRLMVDTTVTLSGYYYENFLHINALSSGYVFEGQSPPLIYLIEADRMA